MPAATRIEWISSGVRASLMWLVTAPPFCARPAMSIMPQPLPSICAAMPRIAPTVTTPVPPMPVTIAAQEASASEGEMGSGTAIVGSDRIVPAPMDAVALRIFAPWTVTKEGQKPLMQEKSLLQFDWSILRLRPNSVSIGCTATQFDFTPQSPQPSQTRSLMMTRLSGSG